MKTWGFARSFVDENRNINTRQIDALLKAGVEEIVFDYRPWCRKKNNLFQHLLGMVQSGDVIVVTEPCRMSGSALEFGGFVEAIAEKKLCLRFLSGITIDCRNEELDIHTRAFVQLTATVTDIERSKLYTARKTGKTAIRRAKGPIGRPPLTVDMLPNIFFAYYQLYADGQLNVTQLAKACKLSRPTIYKYKQIVEEELERRTEEQKHETYSEEQNKVQSLWRYNRIEAQA